MERAVGQAATARRCRYHPHGALRSVADKYQLQHLLAHDLRAADHRAERVFMNEQSALSRVDPAEHFSASHPESNSHLDARLVELAVLLEQCLGVLPCLGDAGNED